uniref:CCHC-type domain-containing protein n=1 Tax=Setaria viridis TaxID=4556 RepID=A0A4U6UFS6_SETVI|nr:hypothetical protein SEVIR_5G103700v2 [Setaria viridis]
MAVEQAQPPVKRIPPELSGRCFNCLSSTHFIAQCRRPTRCFRCHGFWHLARDCKRPRSPVSSVSSAEGGGRRIIRQRRSSPPTPQGRDAFGRTHSPAVRDASQVGRVRARSGAGSPARTQRGGLAPPHQTTNLPRPPLREGPSGSRSDDGDTRGALFYVDDDTPPGHPDSRPTEEVCYLSRDAALDAEEGRLRLSLLAAAPGAPPGAPPDASIDGLRRAISDLPITGVDKFSIKKFCPESFIVTFTTQRARECGHERRQCPHAQTLQFRVSELDGVPAHACCARTARKLLSTSCWIERVEQVEEERTDMSKLKVQAWTDDPRRIPRKKVLTYDIIVRLRHIADFRSRSPSPSPGPSPPSSDGDSGHDGDPDRGYGESRGCGPRLHGFFTRAGVADSCAAVEGASAGERSRGLASGPPPSCTAPLAGAAYPSATRRRSPTATMAGQRSLARSPRATNVTSHFGANLKCAAPLQQPVPPPVPRRDVHDRCTPVCAEPITYLTHIATVQACWRVTGTYGIWP